MSGPPAGRSKVRDFDQAAPAEAAELIGPCCASLRWNDDLVRTRPHGSLTRMIEASDAAIAGLSWPDIEQALSAHPRIGERAGGAERESVWSREEQSAAATPEARIQAALHAGNLEYEQRFGHVFLICATGKTAEQVLAALRARLHNDPEDEHAVVRDELARIVQLRLAKAFDEDGAG
jgi:2-oxo-4-hydroxy-4-carboxy-5-ureidoimidazoline decarboxylase